jgi:hypothetical protein
VNFLELLSDAAATSSSLEVSWRPPSKNSERITGYKLMVATSTGEREALAAFDVLPACACSWQPCMVVEAFADR